MWYDVEMDTLTDSRAMLDKFEHPFGQVIVTDYGHRVVASFNKLVELRGDGVRRVVSGYGSTETEAVDNLWTMLTDEDSFVSVAVNGFDYNYGWVDNTFVTLPSVNDLLSPQMMMDDLRAMRKQKRTLPMFAFIQGEWQFYGETEDPQVAADFRDSIRERFGAGTPVKITPEG